MTGRLSLMAAAPCAGNSARTTQPVSHGSYDMARGWLLAFVLSAGLWWMLIGFVRLL